MPAQPKSVVHLRPDTFGDLVIFQALLARLQEAWPGCRHTVVVRAGYEALAPLFPRGPRWRTIAFNPFRERPAECAPRLEELMRAVAEEAPDLILASAPNRTWMEAAVAARFPGVRSVALGRGGVDPLFAAALKIDLGVDADGAFGEAAPADPAATDWENQHRLADRLLGGSGNRAHPALAVPAEAARRAEALLAERGLAGGAWAAVFAGGLANVQVKAWRPEAFGELAAWLAREQGLPALMLGHVREAAFVEAAAGAAAKGGAPRPTVWLGQDGELPVLAALLARCRIYVGHDTAAMHMAAALDRPVVGIFGGGHWPRFRPAGRRTLSVVHPLPCFGCNWDCHFEDGPCVKAIAVDDVRGAVERALAAGDGALDGVVEARRLSEDAVAVIARATPRALALQRDRIDRQHKIEELKAETDGKDREISELKAEADGKDREIAELKAEADGKDREIAELKAETDDKDREIAGLKAAAEERKRESDTKDAEIAELKAVCNEREALIIQQDQHIKNFQKIVAELNPALAEARQGRERAEAILSRLPPDAGAWADAVAGKETHIRNLEEALAARDRDIAVLQAAVAEKDRSLENYAAGLSALEQAKRFGRLLAEKEAALQNLHRVCVEREALIRRLAAESTSPGAALRKLAIAAAGLLRARLWEPLDAWFFRKTVEEYWMQIGVLRHYDPRPLAWDEQLRRRARRARPGPRIAIVTPCYQQAAFIESTMLSVLNQGYPGLLYAVQDGGSTDGSAEIAARHAPRLRAFASERDRGQADAVRRGFARLEPELGPDDVMAWLNSDDLLAPRALAVVGDYFARHPKVDVVYGHRIIVDGHDGEIGRWIMPRHDDEALEWIDYVPQETLFWRKRAWDRAGGIDPSFQFALDWDLLARFRQAGCRTVRLPYFLGCFRVHQEQKTSQAIHTVGAEEMARIRARFHPGREQDFAEINARARRVRLRGALNARLLARGVRW